MNDIICPACKIYPSELILTEEDWCELDDIEYLADLYICKKCGNIFVKLTRRENGE